jgi:outer membrane protein TolC
VRAAWLINVGAIQLDARIEIGHRDADIGGCRVNGLWHEVVNALVAYRTEQQRRMRLKDQVGHSRRALALSRTRYDTGVIDFITVLDAERTLLQAELQHAQSTTDVSTNLVQLYKALGGGWEQTFPEEPTMSVGNLQSVQ